MYELRRATKKDSRQLRKIIKQVGINRFGVHWKRFFVLEKEGEIIGCVQLKTHLASYQELTSLAILPAWQKKGLSSILMEACIEASTKELFLVCDVELEPLYTRNGFQRHQGKQLSLFHRIHLRISRTFWSTMANSTYPILMIHIG